ncbi:hypothetical protein U1Q18_038797, partial [Sarracenia purpurea var. burkii]
REFLAGIPSPVIHLRLLHYAKPSTGSFFHSVLQLWWVLSPIFSLLAKKPAKPHNFR